MNTAWRWLRVPLLAVAAVLLSPGCNTERSEGKPCKNGDDCASGLSCMEKVCSRPCNIDAECRALAPQCRDGFCRATLPTLCGNGRIDVDESCDSGVSNSDMWTMAQHCNARCTAFGPYCGDSLTDTPHEACDDGNTVSEGPGECVADCSAVQQCGNERVEGTEVCDSGAANNDAWAQSKHCNAGCMAWAPSCGDGRKDEPAEVCDDGENNTDSWSVERRCKLDCKGWNIYCGDGYLQESFEQCDPGTAKVDTSTCDYAGGALGAACTRSQCGDGYANAAAGEACDDGNQSSTDSCLDGEGGRCQSARCGDGLVWSGREQCDDGNQSNTDDCPDGAGGTCQSARCGDGLLWANHEVCDSGAANNDGWGPSQHCNATCTAMAPYCGDGVVQAAHEQCDDGNSASGDGCAACSLEQGWKCHGQTPPCLVVAESCTGRADFTFCDVATSPDRSYDICVGGACVSPGCGDASCNPPGPSFTLADTNQRLCYDATAAMASCPDMSSCASTAFCGQDAQYGWDTAHTASERYTKTEPVTGQPVVLDRVTGLVWQGCAAGRSGALCAGGSDGVYTWVQALAYCDSSSWGGYADWYLPDSYELQSLVDYGRCGLAIDISAFPQMPRRWFWSSSSFVGNPSAAWFVCFYAGFVDGDGKGYDYSVRCVRRGPYARAERFIRSEPVSGQPLVKDNVTGLVWQGCAAGMTGGTCTGNGTTHAWQQALQYCQALDWGGYQDWYLPDVKELASIVDMRRINPAIDIAAFPQTPSTWFWSSSPYVGNPSNALYVYFSYGDVSSLVKSSTNSVRCVRRGP